VRAAWNFAAPELNRNLDARPAIERMLEMRDTYFNRIVPVGVVKNRTIYLSTGIETRFFHPIGSRHSQTAWVLQGEHGYLRHVQEHEDVV
jgi:hypothetical protein